VYRFKRLLSALEHDSNKHLLVVGLDAHGAHRIVVRIFGDDRSHGSRLPVRRAQMP